jgi:hypothetical protein
VADKLPKEFLELLESISAKRAKKVIDHILKHGFVTTEELRELYHYNHEPRGAQDVKDLGIPLQSFRVKNKQDRTIAAYRFGDLSAVRKDVLSGRKTISKKFKQSLVDRYGSRCGICLTEMEARYLQVDHRVPFQVAGEGSGGDRETGDYMLLCGSCNRAKSWSCEHCLNWKQDHEPGVCKTCYWASPEKYKHVAMQELRRLDVTWGHNEVKQYDQFAKLAKQAGMTVGEYVKSLVQAVPKKK